MRFDAFSFGSLRIDGVTYDHDVVIDRGEVRKRKKKPSKRFRTNTATRRCPPKKRYRGDAAGWWWARGRTGACRSWRT
jgi:hypothetical protein